MLQALCAILYNSSLFLQSETQTGLFYKVLMCKPIHLILYSSEVFDSNTKKIKKSKQCTLEREVK